MVVPPTLFISGGVAVLQLCKEIYCRVQHVKRFREDCKQLARFVQRIEGFIAETEEDADMHGPGWEAAFGALHESLLEVVEVFNDCARYGMLRSVINADEINLRLNSITQRLGLALGMVPIQKAKAAELRLAEVAAIQAELRTASFAAARAAEAQSADLKRLIDQSRVDATKTQEMLGQVLALLQADATHARVAGAAAAAAAGGPGGNGGGAAGCVPFEQLDAEVADLQAEQLLARRDKKAVEERYLEQVIAAITAMEASLQEQAAAAAKAAQEVPPDLRCPITYALLRDPVILVESHQTYERSAIEEWLGRGNTKDPVTGITLTSNVLCPNVFARKLAQDWLEAHPAHKQALDAAAAAAAAEQPALAQQPASDAGCVASSGSTASGAVAAGSDAAAAVAAATAAAAESEAGDAEEPEFEMNPKTAAWLAAAEAAAATQDSSSASDAAFLFALPVKGGGAATPGTSVQTAGGEGEKQVAQRAYAAAVAAAAGGAHQRPEVVAAVTLQAPPGTGGLQPAPSIGSSITFARLSSVNRSSSLCSFLQPSSADALPSVQAAAGQPLAAQQQQQQSLAQEPSLSFQLPPQPQQQQQLQQQPMRGQQQGAPVELGWQGSLQQKQQQMQQHQHQQQQHVPAMLYPDVVERDVSPQPTAQSSSSSLPDPLRGFVPAGAGARTSREVQAAGAAAAAAALQHQQHGGGSGFTLQQLQSTLDRAADTRRALTMAHGTQEDRANVEAAYAQQQSQRQRQEEAAYLQQHMQQLQLGSGGGIQHSLSAPATALHAAAGSSRHAQFATLPPGASGDVQRQAAQQLRLQQQQLLMQQQQQPAWGEHAAAAASSGGVMPGSPMSADALPEPGLARTSTSTRGSKGSWSGLGFGRRNKKGANEGPSDDAASTCSEASSGVSRRSLGKSVGSVVGGMLKSISYTMVYEDDKC